MDRKTLYRIEPIQNCRDIILIDEIDRFQGVIDIDDFFVFCLSGEDDPREIDDYVYYYGFPEIIKKYLRQ